MTDFQRNEIALKYESLIAEKMKERQVESGISYGGGGKGVDQMNHTFEKTTKRKELSKIAGTSEGSVQRTKLILDKGTPEQIQRAREGPTGQSLLGSLRQNAKSYPR